MSSRRAAIDFGMVERIALTLRDVELSTSYGAPAVKWRGQMLACVPVNKSAEPNSAVFRIDFERRTRLLQTRPDLYYVTDHYAPHAVVLVRLSQVSPAILKDLLQRAHEMVERDSSAPRRAADRGSKSATRHSRRRRN
jgi:hypothetical protein